MKRALRGLLCLATLLVVKRSGPRAVPASQLS